ncbi:MAG: sugar transferase [Phycisphaerales bacterium]
MGVSGAYGMAGQPLGPADVCVGAVWIGDLGRVTREEPLLAVGPAFVPDAVARPPIEIRPIAAIFSPDSPSRAERTGTDHWGYALTKRAFDVVFSLAVLVAIAPLLVVACVLIAVEDGLPVHYFQWRESLGGREFRCWKLRSMRRGAESMVKQLQALNQSDGPQVFIKDDPRVTRIGRIIRKLQIDEFPQFINVLLGDMSVVGPRPSPRKENQFCPAWRETRLSVRPGITGLWQVMRTRAPGKDFQEWIRYDTEYVERMGFWLDMWIIWRTVVNLVTGGRKPGQDS